MQQKNNFLKVYPWRFFLILFFSIVLSLQTVQAAEEKKLVPAGKTVGVTMDTEGLLVLGIGTVAGENNRISSPGKSLQEGDRILQVNGKKIENKEAFQKTVEGCKGQQMTLLVEREEKQKELKITPAYSVSDQTYKIGIWIRDSIQGIGTTTYYDPENGTFAALGHGVYDVDTDGLMVIRDGALAQAEVTEIVKGTKGEAGELMGKVYLQEKIARIEKNTEKGIFGSCDRDVFAGKALPVAEAADITEGKAYILSDLEGAEVKAYAVEIEKIQEKGGKNHKDMMIRITDERLLDLTGGIVQGMSGSPIIQDGKLVGAVTYVLVNDPSRGYGIFIGNMMEPAD